MPNESSPMLARESQCVPTKTSATLGWCVGFALKLVDGLDEPCSVYVVDVLDEAFMFRRIHPCSAGGRPPGSFRLEMCVPLTHVDAPRHVVIAVTGKRADSAKDVVPSGVNCVRPIRAV